MSALFTKRRSLLIASLFLIVVAFFALGLHRELTFTELKSQHLKLLALYNENPTVFSATYLLTYAAVAALSLPGAAVLTLLAGAVFGLTLGTILVSISSTLGATMAFVVSRYLFRSAVSSRYPARLAEFNAKFSTEGPLFLLALRLNPVVPFFLINILMALTPISTFRYVAVSMLGMLPGTLLYVNAGTQLGLLTSPGDVLSPKLLASLAAVGIAPWLVTTLLRRR